MKRPASTSWTVIAILGAAASITALAVDMTLPALPDIARTLQVSPTEAQLTISAFLIAYAGAQLVYGPLSDRFGRRPVLVSSLAIFVAASALCAAADSIDMLLLGRFCQGVGAAASMAIGRACIRDIYGTSATGPMSWVMLIFGIGPILAPLLGGLIVGADGWQGVFICLLGIGAALWLVIFLFLDETNTRLNPDATRAGPILRNFAMLGRHRLFLGYALVTIGLYGSLFAMLSALPFILESRLAASPEDIGFSFAALMVGNGVGAFLSARLSVRLGTVALILTGATVMIVSAAAMIAAVSAGADGFAVYIGPLFGAMLGVGLSSPSLYAGVLVPFPTIAGSVSSLIGIVQFVSAAVLGAIAVALVDPAGLNLGFQMAAQAALAAFAIAFVVRPALRRLDRPAGA